jgi:hypothetical protein
MLVNVYGQNVFSLKEVCGETHLKLAERHWMIIQRNTEADQRHRTLMEIVSLSKVW